MAESPPHGHLLQPTLKHRQYFRTSGLCSLASGCPMPTNNIGWVRLGLTLGPWCQSVEQKWGGAQGSLSPGQGTVGKDRGDWLVILCPRGSWESKWAKILDSHPMVGIQCLIHTEPSACWHSLVFWASRSLLVGHGAAGPTGCQMLVLTLQNLGTLNETQQGEAQLYVTILGV